MVNRQKEWTVWFQHFKWPKTTEFLVKGHRISLRSFRNSISPWLCLFLISRIRPLRVLVCLSCVYMMYSLPSTSYLSSISPHLKSCVSLPGLIPKWSVHIIHNVYMSEAGVSGPRTFLAYITSSSSSVISSAAIGLLPLPMDLSCFCLAARISRHLLNCASVMIENL